MTKFIRCTLSRPIPIFSGIWFYIYSNQFFNKKKKRKAAQGINLIIDNRVEKWTDANYTITNSWKTLQIAIIYHALHDIMTSQCRKWMTFSLLRKTKLGVAWYLLTSCKHVLILHLICSLFLRTYSLQKCFQVCIQPRMYMY